MGYDKHIDVKLGKISRCCGCRCPFGTKEEPCWGDVNVVDETPDGEGGWDWVHACEGHQYTASGGEYLEPETDEDKATLRENDEDIE